MYIYHFLDEKVRGPLIIRGGAHQQAYKYHYRSSKYTCR